MTTKRDRAFTLVEVLVGCTVLIMLLGMLVTMTNHTTAIVRTASSRVDAFQSGRMAFDAITQRLSQATMNTYWDYYNASNQRPDPSTTTGPTSPANFIPTNYGRASDLQFLIQSNGSYGQSVFFAAPEAFSADPTKDQTQGLLNGIGYFVQYGSDQNYRPSVVGKSRYRYRLMQTVQPAENFLVYASGTTSNWVGTGTSGVIGSAWPIADNVIALIVWPRLSVIEDPVGNVISQNYLYNSRVALPASGTFPIQYAQMPPSVQVTMVVIDDPSASRLDTGSTTEPVVINSALTRQNSAGENLFTDVTQYDGDLKILTDALSAAHVNYEVFSSMVSLRESKWSSQ